MKATQSACRRVVRVYSESMAGVCSRPHLWYGEFEASRTTSLIYGWVDLDLWNWWILSLYTVMKELTSKLKLLYLFRWDMWHKLWSACDLSFTQELRTFGQQSKVAMQTWHCTASCHQLSPTVRVWVWVSALRVERVRCTRASHEPRLNWVTSSGQVLRAVTCLKSR